MEIWKFYVQWLYSNEGKERDVVKRIFLTLLSVFLIDIRIFIWRLFRVVRIENLASDLYKTLILKKNGFV